MRCRFENKLGVLDALEIVNGSEKGYRIFTAYPRTNDDDEDVEDVRMGE